MRVGSLVGCRRMLAAVLFVACAAMFSAAPCAEILGDGARCAPVVVAAQACCEFPSADGSCPEEGGGCSCPQVPGLTSTHSLEPDTAAAVLALAACPSPSSVPGGPPLRVPIS